MWARGEARRGDSIVVAAQALIRSSSSRGPRRGVDRVLSETQEISRRKNSKKFFRQQNKMKIKLLEETTFCGGQRRRKSYPQTHAKINATMSEARNENEWINEEWSAEGVKKVDENNQAYKQKTWKKIEKWGEEKVKNGNTWKMVKVLKKAMPSLQCFLKHWSSKSSRSCVTSIIDFIPIVFISQVAHFVNTWNRDILFVFVSFPEMSSFSWVTVRIV